MTREFEPRPTISDVARAAGVSIPTVSRVLNGTVPVSESRREAVLAAVKAIGYRPNASARALVRGERPIVAVITSDTTVYGNALTLRGIEETARQAGLVVVITVVDSADDEDVERTIDLVLAQPVAGIIVLDLDPIAGAVLERLPSTVPVVAAGVAHADRVPSTYLDVAHASAAATRHLLELGHPTVHFVGPQPGSATGGRVAGWRAALSEAGAPIPDLVPAEFSPEAGYRAGQELLAAQGVTAVLCGNDEIAMGVMSALADAGVAVPEQVSVVGFDDLPLGRVWRPALTTVRLDFASLGRSTFALLEESIGHEVPTTAALEAPELLIRQSTAKHVPAGAV